MWDKVSQIVSKTIKPVGDVIDNIHTSEEEKMKAKKEMEKVKNELTTEMVNIQKEEIKAKKDILVTQANSQHWLLANWRALVAIGLGAIAILVIFNNKILAPYINVALEAKNVMVTKIIDGKQVETVASVPILELPKEVWTLLTSLLTFGFLGKSGEIVAGRMSKNHDSSQEDFR